MRNVALTSALVATLMFSTTATAKDEHHPGQPQRSEASSPGQAGTPMTGMMQMMAGSSMAQCERTEGSIAFLRTELKITAAQAPTWDKFAATVRMLANETAKGPMSKRVMMGDAKGSWPVKMNAMSQHAEDHAAKLKALADAASPLYSALSVEQKKTADDVLPIAICASGAMGMRMGGMSSGGMQR